MPYDHLTRFLHLFIAFGVTVQMVLSQIMHDPKPGRAADIFYEMHEVLGVGLLGVLAAHWLWSLVRRGPAPLGLLFPWLLKPRRAALREDIRLHLSHALRLTLPPAASASPLAAAIQGVGLTVATLLGMSGTLLWLYATPGQDMTGWLDLVEELHEGLGPLMWTYLALHVGAAIAHQLAGHGLLRDMFAPFVKSQAPQKKRARNGVPMTRLPPLILACLLVTGPVTAATINDTIAEYARQTGTMPPIFTAERGRALFFANHPGGKAETPSCTSCHGRTPKERGVTRAGKPIEPLAPSVTPERFSDPEKVEKWFRRNCKSVLGRVCTTREKGDFLTFMRDQ